uniref:Uncharacterized protein n=1 Tax=Anguilla anguilla TaxID=7936 RepID=A0A0E9U6S7_ANGAN
MTKVLKVEKSEALVKCYMQRVLSQYSLKCKSQWGKYT